MYAPRFIDDCRLLCDSAEGAGTGFLQLGDLHRLQHVVRCRKFRYAVDGIVSH